jgi:hypothetical protein
MYWHQGYCGFVPHAMTERTFDRIEQQAKWEEEFYDSERRHFGEEEQAEARAALRDTWDREVDLGGILAQSDRTGD